MLDKVVFQKDHYSSELFLDCKNCEIIPDPESPEWVFLKVTDDILKSFSEIKRDILVIINRNPELYCDCKKFIKLKSSFEEVIKVKTNENILNITETKCDVKICVHGIWFGQSSFGPMVRLDSIKTNESSVTFMDQDDSSDEEMLTDYFSKVNLKNRKVKKEKKQDGK